MDFLTGLVGLILIWSLIQAFSTAGPSGGTGLAGRAKRVLVSLAMSVRKLPIGKILFNRLGESATNLLEYAEARIRELESKVAEQASELATLRLELSAARTRVTQLERDRVTPFPPPAPAAEDPLLKERLVDLEKQVQEFQLALEARTAENKTLRSRVNEMEASVKSTRLQTGVDVGGGIREI